MKTTLNIEGLDCASCAAELEEELGKISGINSASVSFVTQKIFLEYETDEALLKAKDVANHFEEVRVLEDTENLPQKTTLNIEGLDCAACAAELEEELGKIDGIISVSVSFVMQKIALEYKNEAALKKVVDTANHFEEVRVLSDGLQKEDEAETDEKKERNGKVVLKLEGLHCAACAAELEAQIAKIKGIRQVSVDFVGQKISLEAESKAAYEKAVKTANRFEKVRVLNGDEAGKSVPQGKGNAFTENKKQVISILVSCVFFALGIVFAKWIPGNAARILSYVCYAIAYLSVGYPVLVSTVKNVAKGRVFDENFLMTIASVGAVILGDYAEGVAVMLLYQIGEWLQAVAVGSSRRSVTDLMALKSESANLIKETEKDGAKTEEIVSVVPEKLKAGDIVLVRAGEKVPCDGVLIGASASLDTKSLTGEAEYRSVSEGEEILSGCINAGEVFRMRITKEYKDSAVKRILDLMENSTAQKAQSEKFITKFSRYYTPIVCISALAVAFLLPLIDVFKGLSYTTNLARWMSAALNFLVISCPCALIISVPLTYFSGLGACAREGVLVKGSTYLDALAKAETIALDKTGTLTKGDFSVTKVHANQPFTKEDVLAFAAAAEKNSTHPLARAFAAADSAADKKKTISAEEIAGNGIKATLESADGKTYEVLCGKAAFLENNGIKTEPIESTNTLTYVSVNGEYAGCVEIGDTLRETAKSAIADLKATGVKKAVMLTGDSAGRAESVAAQAGLDDWKAGLLPDEKLAEANELKKQGGLIYVGDGINDAPVMATADCAVSMGKLGAAAAVEASDLVLVSDDLSALAKGRRLAKKTQKIVKENIVFSIFCKVAFLVMSIAGIVPLWLAVFADVGVMMLAVLNALRMARIEKKKA